MDAVALDPIAELLAVPGEGRYEWAEGSLVEMSPPGAEHGRSSLFLAEILDVYAQEHDLGVVFPDGLAVRLGASARIPDVAFFRNEHLDRVRPTHAEGPPDLVVEVVSPGSGARDRGEKFDEYEAAGVEEYWIVDPGRRLAEFYRLEDGVYRAVLPDGEGHVYSSALKGFWLRVEWLWNRPKLTDAMRDLGLL